MSSSAPVATLVILGAVIAVLGLFAAGDIAVTALGLAAVFAAGLLEVATSRTRPMTGMVALVGILLILVAIPLGLMIAPLALGVVFIWYALRRVDGALDPRMDAAT